VHTLGTKTVGVEIEPEWAGWHERTKVGDSRFLKRLFPRRKFDLIVTSPTYANRFADHHEAKDKCKPCKGKGTIYISRVKSGPGTVPCGACDGVGLSKRHTYRHYLGRMPTEGSSAVMQWGPDYRDLHEAVWEQVAKVTEEGALFVLNISNHMRRFEEVDVAGWHKAIILAGPWKLIEEIPVRTPRLKHGENHQSRVAHEWIYCFRRTA
jgi:hypothetical protein